MDVAVLYEVDAQGDLVRFVNAAGIEEGYAYAQGTEVDVSYWPSEAIEQSCRHGCGVADDACRGQICEPIAQQQQAACMAECQGDPAACGAMCRYRCQETCTGEVDCISACAGACSEVCEGAAIRACNEAVDASYCWDSCDTLCEHTCG
jgi:hypothetical protein